MTLVVSRTVLEILEGVVAGGGAGEARFLGFPLRAEPRLALARVYLHTQVIRTSFQKVILAVPFFGNVALDGALRAWRRGVFLAHIFVLAPVIACAPQARLRFL